MDRVDFLASGPPSPVEYLPRPSEEPLEGDVYVMDSYLLIINRSSHTITRGSIKAKWGSVEESPSSVIKPGQVATAKVATSSYWVAGPEGEISYIVAGAKHCLRYNHPNIGNPSYSADASPSTSLAWKVFPRAEHLVDRFHQVAYVLYDVDPVAPEKWPFENWMAKDRDCLKNCSFDTVTIAGTHNSNTASLSDEADEESHNYDIIEKVKKFSGDLFIGVIKGWSKCQNYSVHDQLRGGVRYFDLRLTWNPAENQVMTEHGLYDRTPVEAIFSEVAMFLDANPDEFIVFMLSRYRKMDDEMVNTFHDMVRTKLGNRIVSGKDWRTKFEDLWKTPGRVLLMSNARRRLKDKSDVIENTKIHYPWNNAQSIPELKNALQSQLKDAFGSKMIGYGFTMTETADIIGEGFYKRTVKPHTLYGYSAPLNHTAAKWLNDEWAKKEFGVIGSDFALCGAYVPFAVYRNRVRALQQSRREPRSVCTISPDLYHFKICVKHPDDRLAGFRRFAMPEGCDFAAVVAEVGRLTGLPSVRLSYIDEDGDLVHMSSDVELTECLSVQALIGCERLVRLQATE